MLAFLKLYGFYYPILRPAYYLLGIYRIYFEVPKTFTCRGKTYSYFHHWYGMTYLIERIIEVPIVWEKVRQFEGKRILEVGNCLRHFFPLKHDILDKYDEEDGVMHVDVVDYKPQKQYDLIVSISTIEHVGWDEKPREPMKTMRAIENLVDALAPNGELMITWSLGYNQDMDRLFREGKIRFTETYYMLRTTHYSNRWKEGTWDEVRHAQYAKPFRSGNAIVFGHIRLDRNGKVIEGKLGP